jgi:hypothetical protein
MLLESDDAAGGNAGAIRRAQVQRRLLGIGLRPGRIGEGDALGDHAPDAGGERRSNEVPRADIAEARVADARLGHHRRVTPGGRSVS